MLNELEASGDLVKGFLIQGLHEVCWGWKDALERAEEAAPVRDFVLPPSDVIAPYFADILRQRFGFGSAYMVFRKSEAVAAFKANTRDKVLDVTDWEGRSLHGGSSRNSHGSTRCPCKPICASVANGCADERPRVSRQSLG